MRIAPGVPQPLVLGLNSRRLVYGQLFFYRQMQVQVQELPGLISAWSVHRYAGSSRRLPDDDARAATFSLVGVLRRNSHKSLMMHSGHLGLRATQT